MDINQKDRNRFSFLQHLYEEVKGDTEARVNTSDISKKLGFNREETRLIVKYLADESLIKTTTTQYSIWLDHKGRKEIEEALRNPDKATKYFSPYSSINIIHINNMENSVLQQGTINSEVNSYFDNNQINNLDNIINEINSVKETLDISINLHKELMAEIQTLQSQKQSPRPKNIIIKESLKSIRTILEGAAGNTVATIIQNINNIS